MSITVTQLRKVVKANNAAIQNLGSKASLADLQRVILQRESVYTLIKMAQAGQDVTAQAASLGIFEQRHSGRAQSTFNRQAEVIKESAWHRRHLRSTLPLSQRGTLKHSYSATGIKAAEQAEAASRATKHTAKTPVTLAATADWLLEAASTMPTETKQQKAHRTRTVNKGRKLAALAVTAVISQAAARADRDASRPEAARLLG